MDKKYLIFETEPHQGQLETIANQLKQHRFVGEIRQRDCGLVITYAGSYDEFLEQLGTLPPHICVEPLGTVRQY